MGLEDLIMRLRIEEDNHGSEKKTGGNSMVAKAHVVEDGPKNKKKRKHSGEGYSQGNSQKTKGSRATALTTTSMVIEQRTLKPVIISEVTLVNNTMEWTRKGGSEDNLWQELTLNQVLHMPNTWKNLVFGALLSKNGFKLVFEANKFVFTKNGMYVGKGYLNNSLFKMNVMTIVPSMNLKNTVSSAYILESPNIWHEKETRVVLSVKMVSQQQTKDSGSKKLGMVAPQDKSSKEMKSSKKMKFHHLLRQNQPARQQSLMIQRLVESYIGVLARSRVPLVDKKWSQIPKDVKEQIWEAVDMAFVVGQGGKKSVLASAAKKWKDFKSTLTRHYILAYTNDKEKLSHPPETYKFIEKAQWDAFVASRLSQDFESVHSQHAQIREKLEYNHRLS
ncbi:hypothetical protein L3X38_033029 [Prunus dulcis]|uniref:Uncharacterized protein n=1 Tax=Prunus dulcis TaxID=3755 RepID=A0AAD4VHB2_PRUDU|nr:hypothetical protein L3X38_033029 [Prunus dulcis]